ncbi:MAG: phospholipase [Actinobacteria bacterium]|nr:phospholipase [Actinomycetota bacterium]
MRALRLIACCVGVVGISAVAVPSTETPPRVDTRPVQSTGREGVAISPELEKIEHIVIIMQENRSFDHYFGTFPGAEGFPRDAAGNIDVCVVDPYNNDACAVLYHDPRDRNFGGPHSYRGYVVARNGGAMDGYLKAYQDAAQPCVRQMVDLNAGTDCGRNSKNPMNVLGYKERADIPNYWTYAEQFVLQDHMFASSNSWTLPAHLYMVSGWSARCRNENPMSCVTDGDAPDAPVNWQEGRFRELFPKVDPEDIPEFRDPIYAWTDITYLLHRAKVSWGYYVFAGEEPDCDEIEGPITCTPGKQDRRTPSIWNPMPYFTTVQENNQLGNIESMRAFDRAVRNNTLPAVSWLIPSGKVSEHPRSRVSDGQAHVTRVINNLMQSDMWESTAIFVSWDDWGGFYDHMPPPEVDVNGYGIRVPGLVISPYAKQGFIDKQVLSHDAYLKFIEDVFLNGERIDPRTNGRPDRRPLVREDVPILGDLRAAFDFNQPPRPPLILEPYPEE